MVFFGNSVDEQHYQRSVWVLRLGLEERGEELEAGVRSEIAAIADVGDLWEALLGYTACEKETYTHLDPIELQVTKEASQSSYVDIQQRD